MMDHGGHTMNLLETTPVICNIYFYSIDTLPLLKLTTYLVLLFYYYIVYIIPKNWCGLRHSYL